jgi:hypothetical protein
MGIRVFDDLMSTRDVELERAMEVCPLVHLFWAHFTILIRDKLFLAMQVHAPLVDNLNPIPILRQNSRIVDDNVNLMQHALDVQHEELNDFSKASHKATRASDHHVLAINRH